MIVFNHGDLPCERIDESPFEPPVVEEEEEGMPFQTTLYPIFTKNGKSINHFKQTGSFWRKQGFFCNNDLYLLPPVQNSKKQYGVLTYINLQLIELTNSEPRLAFTTYSPHFHSVLFSVKYIESRKLLAAWTVYGNILELYKVDLNHEKIVYKTSLEIKHSLMDFHALAGGLVIWTLSSTVGSEAWNSRDLKSRPH